MCFARLKTGDLFTGDHVMAWSTSVIIPPYGDMAEYLASLKKLLNRQDQRYLAYARAVARQPASLCAVLD